MDALADGGITVDVADALRYPAYRSAAGRGRWHPAWRAGRDFESVLQGTLGDLRAERTKARRAHVVPLAPKAARIVSAALARRAVDGDGRSSPVEQVHGRNGIARHSLSQALRRGSTPDPLSIPSRSQPSEIPPTPHDLRRTLATGLARLGIPREDRLAVFGPSPTTCTASTTTSTRGCARSGSRSRHGSGTSHRSSARRPRPTPSVPITAKSR